MHKTVIYGVTGRPFGSEVTDDDLTSALHEEGYTTANVTRLSKTKGKDKIPTALFKVALQNETLPECIYVAYLRFAVSLIINKPWQCFRCQKFGYNVNQCHGKQKCVVCSGPRKVEQCTANC